MVTMKKEANIIFEDPDFHDQDFGIPAKDRMQMQETQLIKIKKATALQMAREYYAKDQFNKLSRPILERYKQLRDEVVDKYKLSIEHGLLKGNKPIRIGGPLTGSSSLTDTVQNFFGEIGLVSAYPYCLNADQIR